ncbi:MAG: DUF3137 domain-containing protein [Akkermansiaceae bacterium]|nr:DUF3137 domain-containing protein [Akkermansiaceae bacterium]NNM29576.1 DUF3137 domain-containing protein [Akkermansiaceae bacterium]
MTSASESGTRTKRSRWDVTSLMDGLHREFDALERFRAGVMQQRQAGFRALGIAGAICGGAGLLVMLVLAGGNGPAPLGLIAGVGAFGIAWIVIHNVYFGGRRSAYEGEFKQRVVRGMTRLLEPEMDYHPHEGLSLEWFRAADLYSGDIDRYACEDLFQGRIGKTDLIFSEVHAEDRRTRTDSKGRTQTYYVTIFRGLLVVADFHKHFRSEVVVLPDFAEKNFGWLGRKMQNLAGNVERMENPEFEEAFVVRAADAVEARYILTPDMQERMLDLRRRLGADVRFAFRDSRVYITIPNSADWFEPSLHVPARDVGQVRTLMGQMAAVFNIVEELNLNTRIWTKE